MSVKDNYNILAGQRDKLLNQMATQKQNNLNFANAQVETWDGVKTKTNQQNDKYRENGAIGYYGAGALVVGTMMQNQALAANEQSDLQQIKAAQQRAVSVSGLVNASEHPDLLDPIFENVRNAGVLV